MLDCHRMIADDALAHHVFNVLHVTPVHGIAVLQPDEGSTNVSWNVFKVVNNNRLLRSSWHENFCCFVVIAEATLIERALDGWPRVLPHSLRKRDPTGTPAG